MLSYHWLKHFTRCFNSQSSVHDSSWFGRQQNSIAPSLLPCQQPWLRLQLSRLPRSRLHQPPLLRRHWPPGCMSRFSYSIKDSDEVNLALKVSSLWFDFPDKDGSGSPSLMVFISYVLSDHCVDTDRSAERASYKEHIKYVWERCCIHKNIKLTLVS